MNTGVPINYVAVFAAAVINMVIGYIWYGPLFGKQWIQESGLSKEQLADSQKKGMAMQYGLMFVGALVMAYVLSHAIVFAGTYLQVFGVSGGLMSGFFNWIGFVAPVTLVSVLWEGKSWKLWGLNNGYYLVSLLLMGALLSLWR